MQNRPDHRSNVFISKKMSYCLRHNPGKYGLKLDEYGFVDVQDFLDATNKMHHFQPKLTEMKIREIMHDSDKERFEIKNGKICALYGHSIPGIIKRKKATWLDVLAGFAFGIGAYSYIMSAQVNGVTNAFIYSQLSVIISTLGGMTLLGEHKYGRELISTLVGLALIVDGAVL